MLRDTAMQNRELRYISQLYCKHLIYCISPTVLHGKVPSINMKEKELKKDEKLEMDCKD